jgi:hypothetical protein
MMKRQADPEWAKGRGGVNLDKPILKQLARAQVKEK